MPRSRRSLAASGSRRGPVSFDPVQVGEAECAAWAAYYRREWFGVLRGAFALVRYGFALGPFGNVRGAWYVLRANQAWAPKDNDPDAARALMARFYRLAKRAGRMEADPVRAAELEVAWWHAHRRHQQGDASTDSDLAVALVRLYAFVYGTEPDVVRPAALHRVAAMAHSDAWVRAGCRLEDPLLDAERRELVTSYTLLRRLTHPD